MFNNLPVLLKRVVIKDYKSIASCDVELSPMTFLIGPNGSGKSNFLDALRFCSDALRHSLDHAVRERGGINEVRRRSSGRPNHFGIRLSLEMDASRLLEYHFVLGAKQGGTYTVLREECTWGTLGNPLYEGYFLVVNGEVVESSFPNPPAASAERLYLVTASGLRGPDALYKAVSNMGFYNLNPDHIRELQPPQPGELLNRDGSNIASVLANLEKTDHQRFERVFGFLQSVAPNIESVHSLTLGPRETLEFIEVASMSERPRRFHAASMSDGTLRALAVLVALFQRPVNGSMLSLVAIEEPEMALHPAAAGVLFDCLQEAAESRQVIVTSHSPDLLDREDVPAESILAVVMEEGRTYIGRLNGPGNTMLEKRLRTVGELMRINQIDPDRKHFTDASELPMQLLK